MIIREHEDVDEYAWLVCRAEAFLDSSCFDDVKTCVEKYEGGTLRLVAGHDRRLIGIIEAKMNLISLRGSCSSRGAVLWNLGVIRAYGGLEIANRLWTGLSCRLKCRKISYCEVWTQLDEPASKFYQNAGGRLSSRPLWNNT